MGSWMVSEHHAKENTRHQYFTKQPVFCQAAFKGIFLTKLSLEAPFSFHLPLSVVMTSSSIC